MSVGHIDGRQVMLPANWEETREGAFCLACRRERAIEVAQQAAVAEGDSKAFAKARRTGLIEFEVRRSPDLSDNMIARTCHTNAAAVTATRRKIESATAP